MEPSRVRPLEHFLAVESLLGHYLYAPAHLSLDGVREFWLELNREVSPWGVTLTCDTVFLDTCKEDRLPWDLDAVHAAVLRVVGRYNLAAGPDYPAQGGDLGCAGGVV